MALYQDSPPTDRTQKIVDYKTFDDYGGDFGEFGIHYGGDFWKGLAELHRSMPFTPMFNYGGSVNSEYVDRTLGAKNSYLSSTIINGVENALYSFSVKENCSNVMNGAIVRKNCTNIFGSRLIISSSNVFFSQHIVDSSDIRYSSNLIGCHHCLNCNDLQNKSYCIENVEYNKEQYLAKRDESIRALKLTKGSNHILDTNIECVDCEDVLFGYQLSHCRNCAFLGGNLPNSNIFDCMNAGGSNSGENHDYYGCLGGGNGSSYVYCSIAFLNSTCIFYSNNLTNCSFCLGCIGLKNKSYCIFNKQYTKEERYEEVDEIFGKMDADGSLGSFFPATMNPFYFNDTAAYLIDPSFTKEEVTAKGYLWRDEPIKVDIPAGVQTVKVSELGQYEGWSVGTQFFASDHTFASDHNNTSYQFADGKNSIPTHAKRTINDEILKKVIIDDQGNAYRIIPMELEFLRKYELPLPRKHWLDRMKENFRIN